MTLAYPPLLWFAPCRVSLPALRIYLRRTRSSALSSPLFISLHLDISFPSRISLVFPPSSSLPLPRHRVTSQHGSSCSLPLSASALVLFLVYFSHPRTVEMQFASELLLLPPSPSRLPRATIGIEIVHLAKIVVRAGRKFY